MPRIINFHDIDDRQWFEDTLDVIQDKFEIVPFSEIKKFYKGQSTAKNTVHLTVDDGHISTYTLIYPVLKERGLTASIFVSPKVISDRTNFWYLESAEYDKQKLRECISEVLNLKIEKLNGFYPRSVMKTLRLDQNWEVIELYREKFNESIRDCQYINPDQLIELEKSGVFDIGAHTMNHPILANENDRVSNFEISESVRMLSEMLGREVDTFAYPNGSPILDFGKREMNFAKDAGIKYAFSFLFKDLSRNDDLLSIPRYGLHHGDKDFIRKKLTYGPVWEPIKRMFFSNEDKYRKKIQKNLFQN